MGKTIQIRVDKSLVEIMEQTRRAIADEIKGKYGLKEITIPGTFTSQVLAARLNGSKVVRFKVNQVSKDKGILQLG